LAAGRGYDLTYVLDHRGDLSKPIARVKGSQSGLTMEVFTTEPSIQLYTGNFLDGSAKGAWGGPIEHRFGLCLETQNFPDAVNHANFPNSIIKPGDTYRQTAIYRFS
jgi:aldose 1-epimerase